MADTKAPEHRMDEAGIDHLCKGCPFEEMIPRLRFLWHTECVAITPGKQGSSNEERDLAIAVLRMAFLSAMMQLKPDPATAVQALLATARDACDSFDSTVQRIGSRVGVIGQPTN